MIQEVLVGSVAIHLDGGPPRFDAIPPDRNSRIVTPQPQCNSDIQPISIREIEAIPESVNSRRFEVGDRVVVPNDLFCIRSKGSGEFWVWIGHC